MRRIFGLQWFRGDDYQGGGDFVEETTGHGRGLVTHRTKGKRKELLHSETDVG